MLLLYKVIMKYCFSYVIRKSEVSIVCCELQLLLFINNCRGLILLEMQ